MRLPQLVPLPTIAKWLPEIFPEGTPSRAYVIREMAAKTLFTMIYVGAVEETGIWLRPDQVTKMSSAQASKDSERSRIHWRERSLRPGAMKDLSTRWYAANTREPIRDETLRNGLVSMGAVVERKGLATTSASPRYAVSKEFYELLLNLHSAGKSPHGKVGEWQAKNLTANALNRIELVRRAAVLSPGLDRIKVEFPNGETRLMSPGPSTIITKAVIEQFARRFLRQPGVVFLSESGNKVVARDDNLARSLGLSLDYARALPDIVLVDAAGSLKVIFVEVVASDGAIIAARKAAFLQAATEAGLKPETVFFVSAFADRSSPVFRKLVSEIAWGTYAWFMCEPDKLLAFKEGQVAELAALFVSDVHTTKQV